MLFLTLLGCYDNTLANRPGRERPGGHDTSFEDTAGDTGEYEGPTRWLFMVYMDGDNDLEVYVPKDLNELERTGSGDGVEVIVQADRIEGYSDKDGDWTGTRRYRIVPDDSPTVVSPMLEDLGELDMGVPETLADFVEWATVNYPAENRVLILWNHGDSWLIQAEAAAQAAAGSPQTSGAESVESTSAAAGAPPPAIAYDDTSGNALSIANGELAAAIETDVATYGRYDVLGFDACNMASWEIAHAMTPYAEYLSAAETTVGSEGFMYEPILAYLRETPDANTEDLAILMSQGAVEQGGELTHSAIHLDKVGELSASIDALARLAMADPAASTALMAARETTRGADEIWAEWWLDVGDLADNAALSGHPGLQTAAADVRTSLDSSVVGNFHSGDYSWSSGLTIFFDPSRFYLGDYTEGVGATWSHDTQWDEYLAAVLAAE